MVVVHLGEPLGDGGVKGGGVGGASSEDGTAQALDDRQHISLHHATEPSTVGANGYLDFLYSDICETSVLQDGRQMGAYLQVDLAPGGNIERPLCEDALSG
jgi:hypothetical protein